MKTALIKVMLKYDFADDVSVQDIIDEVKIWNCLKNMKRTVLNGLGFVQM